MLKTKNKHLRYVITFFAVLCSSLLQTFVIESFVHSAGLLSGGFTGVAILIDRAASLYGGSICRWRCSATAASARDSRFFPFCK